MEPKSMPKLIKNRCQNWYRKRSGKSWKIMFFWKGKTLILSAEHSTVVQKTAKRFRARWMRERETHQKNTKNETKIGHKINEKSMQNPCSEKWWKKHRKSSTLEPKRTSKYRKNLSKIYVKKISKKRGFAQLSPGSPGSPEDNLFKDLLRSRYRR